MNRPDSGGARLRELFQTRSPQVRALLETLGKAIDHEASLLICGETGVGKDHLARSIHDASTRSGPFVRIDCATIPPEIFESELFGYERGAFTGATERKAGRLETAQGGTVYLDGVASLEPSLQAKLLRVLQDRIFMRIGGREEIRIDFRVISSSLQRPEEILSSGSVRDDLYYRLNVLSAVIPPLRERREDIQFLASKFLADSAERLNRRLEAFDDQSAELLLTYRWPGNVRELANIVERASIVARGNVITAADLPTDGFIGGDDLIARGAKESWSLEQLERRYIAEVLRRTDRNYTRAATILGLNRKTLLEKRKKYGLDQ